VLPLPDGFYVLSYSASDDIYPTFLPVFSKLLETFKLL